VAIAFTEEFDLPPIPVDARRAAVQGRVIARKIEDAGGVDAAVEAAVAVILRGAPEGPPSELGRLRVLYAKAYTQVELRSLVHNTFRSLGLARDENGG
jgi:hypothetical protein